MKRLLLSVLILALIVPSAFAQIDTLWTVTLDANGSQSANGIAALSDGYLLAGYTTPDDAFSSDILVAKVDLNGNELWRKSYGSPLSDVATAVAATGDGGFVLTGFTYRAETANRDMFIFKLNASGDSLWYRTFAGEETDEGRAIAVAADGTIYAYGSTNSVGAGRMDELLLTYSADGDSLNAQTFGGNKSDHGMGIAIDTEGNILLAGADGSTTTSNRDAHLTKLSLSGDVLMDNRYNYNNYDWIYRILPLSNGEIAIGGDSDRHGEDFMSMHLFRINHSGTLMNQEDVSEGMFYEHCRGMVELPGGVVLLGGAVRQSTDLRNHLYFGAIDEWGTISEKVIYDMPGRTVWVNGMAPADGGAVVAGYIGPPSSGDYNLFLAKVTVEAASVEKDVNELPSDFTAPVVTPNPFNAHATISFELPASQMVRLAVYDVLGRGSRCCMKVSSAQADSTSPSAASSLEVEFISSACRQVRCKNLHAWCW